MRALQPRSRLLLALVGATLLAAPAAQAQRRVIAAPNAKPLGAAASAEAPAAEGHAAPTDPEAAAAPPAPGAVAPAGAPGAAEAEAKKAEPPPPPKLLVPKDELGAEAAAAKPAASANPAAPAEVLYRRKIERNIVSLRVRPAAPVPGRSTTLMFEVMRLLPVPDPAVGDRMPLTNATLFVNVNREGGGHSSRHRLYPMRDAGVYGMHLTVASAGIYRIELVQQLDNPETGVAPLSADFLLGIGKETPMEGEEDDSAVEAKRGRSALRTVARKNNPGPAETMRQLADRWIELAMAIDASSDVATREALAREIVELASRVAALVPAAHAAQAVEFEGLAGQFAKAVEDLPAAQAEPARAREHMIRVETEQCLKCHARFRFGLTDDVGAWPKFTPRSPQADRSGR